MGALEICLSVCSDAEHSWVLTLLCWFVLANEITDRDVDRADAAEDLTELAPNGLFILILLSTLF